MPRATSGRSDSAASSRDQLGRGVNAWAVLSIEDIPVSERGIQPCVDIPSLNTPLMTGIKYVNKSLVLRTISDIFFPATSSSDLLRKGIVANRDCHGNEPLTILLVGATGSGKSSVIELLSNVFAGRSVDAYEFQELDLSNETGGSETQSQTKWSRLYELKSRNGVKVSFAGSVSSALRAQL